MTAYSDRYGRDVLADHSTVRRSTDIAADVGLVVEDVMTGFVGAVIRSDKHGVTLENRHGKLRLFPFGPGFHIDGKPVALVRPAAAPVRRTPARTASGSVAVRQRAKVARASRIYVEGKHDAELVEKVWGDDLRVEGVVVEELGGADDLVAIVREFAPEPGRRLGVLLDHLIDGTKERRIADDVMREVRGGCVAVLGHPFVDIWRAVRPAALGIARWPSVPKGSPWKEGVIEAIGWDASVPEAWQRILGRVTSYNDLEPALLGRVEELIDFVTSE